MDDDDGDDDDDDDDDEQNQTSQLFNWKWLLPQTITWLVNFLRWIIGRISSTLKSMKGKFIAKFAELLSLKLLISSKIVSFEGQLSCFTFTNTTFCLVSKLHTLLVADNKLST